MQSLIVLVYSSKPHWTSGSITRKCQSYRHSQTAFQEGQLVHATALARYSPQLLQLKALKTIGSATCC